MNTNALRNRQRPLPESLHPVRDALERIDASALGPEEREELGRVLSAALQAVRRKEQRANGITRRQGWDRGAPLSVEGRFRRTGGPCDLLVDHPRREYLDGVKMYISEPYGYGFDAEALRRLAKVAEAGWTVRVDAESATHFPGRTVAVRLCSPGSPSGASEAD